LVFGLADAARLVFDGRFPGIQSSAYPAIPPFN